MALVSWIRDNKVMVKMRRRVMGVIRVTDAERWKRLRADMIGEIGVTVVMVVMSLIFGGDSGD